MPRHQRVGAAAPRVKRREVVPLDRLTSVTLRFRCERPGYVASVSVTLRPREGKSAGKAGAQRKAPAPEKRDRR